MEALYCVTHQLRTNFCFTPFNDTTCCGLFGRPGNRRVADCIDHGFDTNRKSSRRHNSERARSGSVRSSWGYCPHSVPAQDLLYAGI